MKPSKPSESQSRTYAFLLRLQAGPPDDPGKRRNYRQARQQSPAIPSLADFILSLATPGELEELSTGRAGLYRCGPWSCENWRAAGGPDSCHGWHVLSKREARRIGSRRWDSEEPALMTGGHIQDLAAFAMGLTKRERAQIAFDDQQAALDALRAVNKRRDNSAGFQEWVERQVELTDLNPRDLVQDEGC